MDALTRRRQIVGIVIGLVALAMVAAAAASSQPWAIVGIIVSCVALVGWIAYSDPRVRFVQYKHKP